MKCFTRGLSADFSFYKFGGRMRLFSSWLFSGLLFVSYVAAGQELACNPNADEKTAMKQAPGGAKRTSEHLMEVRTSSGTRRFVDQPPHDGISGLHWLYCGYHPLTKTHLIHKQHEALFSGQLLLEESGKILGAGHTVVFSNDGKKYLAIEQQSGMDGEEWAVFDSGGKKIWRGYGGTLRKDKIVSQFEKPRWDAKGELTAQYVCMEPTKGKGTVTLVESGKVWGWRGQGKCD